MAKTKEQKRIERARVKELKRFEANSKKVTEKHRLESKKAESKATLDANMAAVEKTLDMFNTAYENEEKKKKKKPIVFILSAALVVSTAVAGVGIHFANRNNPNDVPLPPGHSDDLDSTATPTDTTTPTPTVTVKPSDNAGDDEINSTPEPDESEKVEDVYIPDAIVTPRPVQTSRPSESINSEHIHSFGEWGYFDEENEARVCSTCSDLEFRGHNIEMFTTYEKLQKDDIHKVVVNNACVQCGYKYSLIKEERCDWKLERYDKKQEYLKCIKCGDTKTQDHNFNVYEENGKIISECNNVGCGYEKVESYETNPPVYVTDAPDPIESENPAPSESIPPTSAPSDDPDRGEIDDGNGNQGIGNGNVKPFDDESEATVDSESKEVTLSSKIDMFKRVKSLLLSAKRTENPAKIMKL